MIFTGVRTDIDCILSAMDVFLMTSFNEGLPVSLVEAQASGLHIVATDTISKEIKLTNLVEFCSLGDSPEKWAQTVLKYAGRIQSLYKGMKQALSDQKQHVTRLTVGITHTAESNPIAEVLAKYGSEHNDVHITMISDNITNLYEKLKTYELDFAIVEGRLPAEGFNTLLLDTDSLVLVVANTNRLAKKTMVTVNELKKEKLILRLPDSGTRNLFLSHLESNNMSIRDFNVILEVDNIATIKDLIRRGFGVSILAKSACLDELKKGKITVLPVENLSMTREINIVYHSTFGYMDILQGIIRLYNETVRMYRS